MNNQIQTPLLQNKYAVIFGAGGAVGTAVAKEFVKQGATVFLSSRTKKPVEEVAGEIKKEGGVAYADEVDALSEEAVKRYLEKVVQKTGRIDILFNTMGPQPKDYGNATPTMDLPFEKFMIPLTTMVPSQFITARSAARYMIKQHSGVILLLVGTPSQGISPNVTAIGTTFGAMESLLRGLSQDLGSSGVRVVGIRSGGMVDTRTMSQTFDNISKGMNISKEQVKTMFAQKTLLKKIPTLSDTANIAAFVVSDKAATLTGMIINASSGAVID